MTFLGAGIRYQTRWILGESGFIVFFSPCIFPVSPISSHYRCRYLLSLLLMSLTLSSLNFQPHRFNQNIESSSVSLCIFRIHLNCFQRSLVLSKKCRWSHPTVTSVNCQQTKYQANNPKGKKNFT